MDNQRMFLWAAVAMVWFFVYQAWVGDHARVPATPVQPTAQDMPQGNAPELARDADLPEVSGEPASAGIATESGEAQTSGRYVKVSTDVYEILISTRGADIQQLDLSRYPVTKSRPDEVVRLLNPAPSHLYVYQTGLRAPNAQSEPNHLADYQTAQMEYRLAEGADTLQVPFTWTGPDGVTVRKIYSFQRGQYRIGLNYQVQNQSAAEFGVAPYLQIRREALAVTRSMTNVDSYSFVGPVLYNGEKYEKFKPDDLIAEPVRQQAANGWIASIQHHFLSAAIPPASVPYSYTLGNRDGQVLASAIGPLSTVVPGQELTLEQTLFAGPKLQKQMEQTAPGLKLTVDYGFLTVIAQPLFWVLRHIHDLVGNWGWSIILLTIMIKLAFYKLQETSGRSMAKMRNLQPRMKHLQERYKDDRQALSQAMMELYRKEKVNPASGCLPIIVQMPVFIALYWVLLESVEMRQAPFALWLNDLSTRDPYFVLPVLMGVTMFFQQKLNPTPPDPIQAKVMMAMPVVFTVFFAFFPSGLVLYWFVNNLLAIAQQWRINKVVAREA